MTEIPDAGPSTDPPAAANGEDRPQTSQDAQLTKVAPEGDPGLGEVMPLPTWTVLVVEDTEDYRRDAVNELENSDVAYGAAPKVLSRASFSDAKELILSETIDVLVLDVQDQSNDNDHAGEELLALIKQTRFMPVVLYTAFAGRVGGLASPPVVQVVGKDQPTADLVNAVKASFDSQLPFALRTLTDHVREVTREYLWDHMADYWGTLKDFGPGAKAQLLVNRLARSLDITAASAGDDPLQGPLGAALTAPSRWHASRFYVIPPMGSPDTGDILRDPASGQYWVQLTPSCDLAQGNADRHLVVRADVLLDVDPFREWRSAESAWSAIKNVVAPRGGFPKHENSERRSVESEEKDLRGRCLQILKGSQDRFFHLPHFLTMPDLLMDMQWVDAPDHRVVAGWERIASLAPPWPQIIVSRYTRQMGRFGYDDPDADGIMTRLSRGLTT